MSEQNPGNGDPVKDEPTVDPAKGPGQNGGEEIEMLKGSVEELEERMQKQSALIGQLTNALKKDAPKEEPKKPTGDVGKYSELQEQIEQLKQKNEKQERRTKLSAIELALVEAGAIPAVAKAQADYFAYKLGDSVTVDDSSVLVADGDGIVPVTVWAKALIDSDEGSYLRAPKTGPSVKNTGSAGVSTSKTKLNSAEYSSGYAEAYARGKEHAEAFAASHEMKR